MGGLCAAGRGGVEPALTATGRTGQDVGKESSSCPAKEQLEQVMTDNPLEFDRVRQRDDPTAAGEVILELVNLGPRQDVKFVRQVFHA